MSLLLLLWLSRIEEGHLILVLSRFYLNLYWVVKGLIDPFTRIVSVRGHPLGGVLQKLRLIVKYLKWPNMLLESCGSRCIILLLALEEARLRLIGSLYIIHWLNSLSLLFL